MNRNTLVYFFSYSLSLLGNGISSVVFPLLVLAKTGDILSAGVVATVTAATSAVVGLFGGVVVDRFNRRTVSISADLLSAASVAALPLVDAIWGLNLSWFVVLAAIGAFADSPGLTAREVLLPRLVELSGSKEGALDRLVGIRESLMGILMLVGPGIGGLLVWLFGVSSQTMLITATTSFLAAMVSLQLTPEAGAIDPQDSEGDQRGVRGVVSDIWTAWKFVARNHLVLGATLLSAVFVAVIAALQTTIVPAYFSGEHLPGLAGLAIMVISVGALVGVGVYAATVGKVSRRTWFVIGMIGAVLGFGLFAWLLSPWLVILGLLIVGLTNGPMSAVLGVATIEATPDEMRGRVLGVQNSLMLAAPALTAAPIAALASAHGLHAAGIGMMVLVILGSVIALASPAFKNLDSIDGKE